MYCNQGTFFCYTYVQNNSWEKTFNGSLFLLLNKRQILQKRILNITIRTGLLQDLRLAHGYSQQNIADMLGLNRPAYTYYETGKCTPSIESLYKLLKLYEMDIEAFVLPEKESPVFITGQKRPGRLISDNIEITGLTQNELSIIVILRTKDNIFTQELLDALKQGNLFVDK